jgi:hypothetical protein
VNKGFQNWLHLHVSAGNRGAVTTRIDSVEPKIDDLLRNPDRYRRVNAVVLTGEAIRNGWRAADPITVRYVYRTVVNQNPRNALPSNFRIFGREFTRR